MRTLMAIGGAVDFEEPVILREFIKRSGGAKAGIVILPQASGVASTGREYGDRFQSLGVKRKPLSLGFGERAEADRKKHLDALRNATGIFLTGGTQMRITTIIGSTDFEQELLAAYRRRTVICGTSAGAAVMSRVMMAYGRGGATTRAGLARFPRDLASRTKSSAISISASATPGAVGVCHCHATRHLGRR